MSIRLIATDMDGTLLDSRKRLPPDFGAWVLAHPEIRVAIASGRPYYTLKRDFGALADHLIFITENGGLVFENGEIIYCDAMKAEDIRACFALFEGIPGTFPVICGASTAYLVRPAEEARAVAGTFYTRLKAVESPEEAIAADTIVKLALHVADFAAEKEVHRFDAISQKLDVVLSGDSWIDFANFTANKGTALEAVMQKHGIAKGETMAFGDYLNDYALLMSSGESYCMANGHPKLKAIAKHLAASNDEDGVMRVLRAL